MSEDQGGAIPFQDPTHLRQALDDAERSRRDAEHSARVCQDLLSIVSHDLRNPLSAITTATALLERVGKREIERATVTNCIATISRSAERMNRLVNDLLDFTRIREGRLTVAMDAASSDSLIDEAMTHLALPAAAKQVRIRRETAGEYLVLCQRNRVIQILVNLGSNAVAFTPAGGRVTFSAEPCRQEVLFSVSDTGIGIEPAEVPQLFHRFWRSPRAEAQQGVGLGLFIVKGLVEAHGGRIWVKSTVGAGTTFFFTLPAETKHGRPS